LADSGHVEVIVWFGWRLILDILGPHLIGDVATATILSVYTVNVAIPRRLKAWGFLIPYRGL
jgi:hypothetical protein